MDYASRALIILGFGALLLARAVFPLASAGSDTAVLVHAAPDSLPTREALFDRFFQSRRLLVVFGVASERDAGRMQNAIRESGWRWRINVDVQSASETRPADLASGAVMLVGTPETNPFLSDLPAFFPLAFQKQGFSFLGKTYRQPQDVVNLLYPNPQNPQYPLFITAGHDENAVIAALDDRMRSYDFQIWRNGQRLRLGHFSQKPGALWRHDPSQDLDYEASTRLVGSTDYVRFFVHNGSIDHSLIAGLIQERKAVQERVASFFDSRPVLSETIQYYLYPSLQDKAVVTDNMDFAHLAADRQAVHVAIEPGIRGDALNKESTLLVRAMLGKPHVHALEDGLSLYLSESWFGASYETWMQRIAHAGLAVSVRDLLLDDNYARLSPLTREPQAAALMACMIDEWGKQNLLDEYAKWIPKADEWPILEDVWSRCIAAHNAAYTPRARSHPPLPFLKGFNFAHEGFGILNGYGSESANRSLEKLSDMGSNAVSIIPYSFMRDVAEPIPFRLPNTAGDENDAAVAHVAMAARQLGFTTMIKPQIWVRGSWPGDIDMQSEEDWQAFFAYYEQWIGHYAMLAEIFDVDILCIGTELSKATLGHEARWADLANRLRSLYSGRLVYASNWGEEFESLRFWDAFDYIGLNSYYPLSDKEDATEADLRKGAHDIANRIEKVQRRFKKPLLLTEIGFPSTAIPWIRPYDENRSAPASPEHQALCYRLMTEALTGKEWLHGIYWWKWPSYLDRGGMEQKGFTPNEKPAERVVADWYRGL